jgi:hypothetical protein
VIRAARRSERPQKSAISSFPNLLLDIFPIFGNIAAIQYFVVMIDYGRRGREAIVDPEITRREVVSRVASGEYKDISFIHEFADGAVEDITADILAEATLPEIALTEIPTTGADLQADRFDHERDLRKHETV